MNKKEFAEYISENMNIPSSQADIVIEVFTSNLAGALFEGHSVGIDGFGSFISNTKVKNRSSSTQGIAFIAGDLLKQKIA